MASPAHRARKSGHVDHVEGGPADNLTGATPVAGDGVVYSLLDGPGPYLTNARIVLIYWGSAWGNALTTPSAGTFTSALSGIINGPWGTQLNQYHDIGPMSIESIAQFTNSDPPTTFTERDVQNFLEARILDGTVPKPNVKINRLYCVLMPTGRSSKDNPKDVGYHTTYTHRAGIFDIRGTPVYYAAITNDGSLTSINSIPKVFSHEVAEAVTDPHPFTGISLIGPDPSDTEIGDVCNNTIALVNGVAVDSYWSREDGRCVLPLFQGLPSVQANPALIRSNFGRMGNFELLAASSAGGLVSFWRNNDNGYLPWSGAASFGGSLGNVDALTMIQSNFGSPHHLEVVVRVGNKLHSFWRDSDAALTWNGPFPLMAGVAGVPALIQGTFGSMGNFEMVVPSASGGLLHFWRNNDADGLPWVGAESFGGSLGNVDAVTMIQSNFGSPGHLEVVVRAGNQLYLFWRDSDAAFTWNGPFPLMAGVTGNPVLIQGRFGTKGNFEMVVPSAAGGLMHFWRDNDAAGLPWIGPASFGGSLGNVDAVAMIESNFGSPGHLEVVVRVGYNLLYFWRDSGPDFTWNGPSPLLSTIW